MTGTRDGIRGFRAVHAGVNDPEEALARVRDGLADFPATLAVLYVTDPLAARLPQLVEALRGTTGIPNWIGAAGMGVCGMAPGGDASATGSAGEYHGKAAFAVLAVDCDGESFRLFAESDPDLPGMRGALSDWIRTRYPGFALVHGDPRNAEAVEILEALSAETESVLAGGLTAAPGLMADPKAPDQVTDRPLAGAVSGVLLSGRLEMATGLSQGCRPIGPVRRVTAGEGNVIATLDGVPAINGFIDDIGPELAANPAEIGGRIFAAKVVPGAARGDYLVRNLVGLDPERGLVAIGDTVEPGEGILFCSRDRDSAIADMMEMLNDLKRRAGKPPRAGFYHSCVARGPHMFDGSMPEIEMIRQVFGPFPLAGFFGNGEVSNGRLYGYTGVLSLFF